MKHKKCKSDSINGTSLKGYITTTYAICAALSGHLAFSSAIRPTQNGSSNSRTAQLLQSTIGN
jgi:hypothetical protein